MGNQIENNNNKKIVSNNIIKATIESSSISQSNIIFNESDYNSISGHKSNLKFNLIKKNLCQKDKEKYNLLNRKKSNKIKKYNTLKNSNNNFAINNQKEVNISKNNNNILNNCKNIDNNGQKENENINKEKILNNQNKEELELNNKEDDSKFINFSIIDDNNSDMCNISKIDNDTNNNLYFNEKKKDISEYEYEFEEYINKLNMNNINIDKQLHDRPLSSPFNSIYMNPYNQKKKNNLDDNNINSLGKIVKHKINNRNQKKEFFNDLKISVNKKAIKIFETSNNININKNKYFDNKIINSNNKIINENHFSSNEKILNKEKNIINIQPNTLKKNKIFISNNGSTSNTSHYEKTINDKIDKKCLIINKNLLMKKDDKLKNINANKIKVNIKQNKKIKFERNNKTTTKSIYKNETKYLTQSNSRKTNRILSDIKKRDIKELIQKNNMTHLFLHRNKNYNKNHNSEIKRKCSLSQTFSLKRPKGDLDNCINFFTKKATKSNKIRHKNNNLKIAKSCSNLFLQYNKLRNKNNDTKKKSSTTKKMKNSISLEHFKKIEISNKYKLLEPITSKPKKKFSLFEKRKNYICSKKISLNKNKFLLKRNIYEIMDITNLLKENGLNNIIIDEDNIKTKNVICFINGPNLEIFNNKNNKNNLEKKVIQIKTIQSICILNESKNIIIINYLDKELKKVKKVGLLIENENAANEYIQNLKKISNNFTVNYGFQNII